MNTTIQLTGTDNGKASPSLWFSDNYAYGYIFPEGKTDCKNIVPKALTLWGWGDDTSAFLRALGYNYNPSKAQWTVANRDNLRNKFDSAVQAKYYGISFANDPVQSGAARYEMYLNIFSKACNAKDLGTISSISNSSYKSWLNSSTPDRGKEVSEETANISGTKDGYYVYFSKVNVVESVNGAPAVVPHGYAYQASSAVANEGWNGDGATSNGDVRIYGYHNAAVERSCHDIQKGISDNAPEWLSWKRLHPDVVAEVPITTGNETPTDEGEVATSCAIETIGWLVCPAISFTATIADSAFKFLSDSFLRVDVSVVSTDKPTYAAWSTMRNIANVAFVIAFLFIIFSQLTGQGIANYGIKKMLPRLVIAAILVNVSFFICQIAVDLSNIIGYSIKQVFDSTANGIPVPAGAQEGDQSSNWVGITTTVLALAGGAWALGASVLIPFLLGAVIALVMVFIILILRQMLIILLIVVAPIAFVAFLLPNTEQWFTKWRKMFVGLLLVFPTIGLIFGASSLASSILLTAAYPTVGDTDNGNIIGQIVATGVIALPLFLIWPLLKGALNSAGSVGAKINGMGDRFNKNAKGRLANSGVIKALDHQKQTKRAQIGAGIYEGKNPISKGRSFINGRLNQNKAYNAVTGNYGTIRGANIDKLEGEETKLAEAAVQLQARGENGIPLEKQFNEAVKAGNVVRAKAAQNILMRSGSSGVKSARSVTDEHDSDMSDAMRFALSSNITENHGLVAKQKAPDLLKWATSQRGENRQSLKDITKSGETWSSLSARELADLPDAAFKSAMESGGVSRATKDALLSERLKESLSDGQRTALTGYKPPTVITPAANKEFSRQTIEAMGPENVKAAVDRRGGIAALNENDIVSIINAHGGTPVGTVAREEAIKRNIIKETHKRDPNTMPKP